MPSLALRAGIALTSASGDFAVKSSLPQLAARNVAGYPGQGSEVLRSVQRRAALASAGVCAARCGTLYAAALELARSEVYSVLHRRLLRFIYSAHKVALLTSASTLAMPCRN